ncbi:MAG: DUF2283 domain-containing protein [Candidatus Latescibacterota bacterium]|nr:DUF2283 domain-containing protein [Candidatus Latescibacterota bacterium]
MKVTYDQQTDTLSVILRNDVAVVDSDEEKQGVVLDYGEDGHLVSIEVLEASSWVTDATHVDFARTGQ